jgi:hypothetical protein
MLINKKNDFTFEWYKKGMEKEKAILPNLKQFFKDETIKRARNRYAVLDFEGDGKYLELKNRFCYLNTYKTTMVGRNKIDYILENDICCPVYFVFSFYCGLYYYEFNREHLDIFQTEIGGTEKRGRKEYKPHYYIPIEYLKPIPF